MPCLEDQLTNDAAFVSLFSLPEDLNHNQTMAGCFAGMAGAKKIQRIKIPVMREFDEKSSSQLAVLQFEVNTISRLHNNNVHKAPDF